MAVRRVVITGMGCVNALGRNVEEFWENAKQGRIGIATITGFDVEGFKVKVAAEIKGVYILEYLPSKLAKRTERFTHLAMIAAKEAVENSGLLLEQEDPYRMGVCVSSGIGGLSRISKEILKKAFSQYAYDIPINSTKSLIGHTLAGSGAIEAIVCLLSMRDSYLHVTAGLQETEGECDLDYIKGTGRQQAVEMAMSNSFGFGGHNSILIFKKYKERK